MAQPPPPQQRPDGAGAGDLDDIPDPKGHPIIPTLGVFSPALFVPIPASETFLDDPSATRLDHLQRRLQALDAHAVANRENFLNLCVRERERIKQEGRRLEALAQKTGQAVPPDTARGLHPLQQQAQMIANMEAQPVHEPGSFEVTTIPKPHFTTQPSLPVRERQAAMLLDFAGFAADLAETREADIAGQRAELEAEIKTEQAKEEQARVAK